MSVYVFGFANNFVVANAYKIYEFIHIFVLMPIPTTI